MLVVVEIDVRREFDYSAVVLVAGIFDDVVDTSLTQSNENRIKVSERLRVVGIGAGESSRGYVARWEEEDGI